MANRFMGEVTAQADGETYTLRMDMNAMIEFEDATGIDPMKAFENAEGGVASLKVMRAIIHAAMKRRHPEASIAVAGDILSEDPTVVGRLMAAAAPEPEKDAGGKAKAGAKRAA
jgi:hypothetical protein